MWLQFVPQNYLNFVPNMRLLASSKSSVYVIAQNIESLSNHRMLFQAQLTKALAEPVEALLDSASEDTWPAIRKLLQRETKAAVSGLESALSAFELDEASEKDLLAKLENHGRRVVESKAKEEAGRVLIRMKDR